jgi:hypothetical protein
MAIAGSNHCGERVLIIRRIFFSVLLALGLISLAGCNYSAPNRVVVPDDIKAVTVPFLNAVTHGKPDKAEKFMAEGAIDDAREQFEDATVTLSTGPNLLPVMVKYKPNMFGQPDTNDVTVLYAAKKDKLWTSVQMRLFRLKGEPYEIEYFFVKNEADMPPALAAGETFKQWMIYGMAAMSAFALLFLAILIWIVRRKTHIIAPEQSIDIRALATTRQEE